MGDVPDTRAPHRRRAILFGIRAKLWLAFGVVAAMTVVASAIALRSFGTASDTLDCIAQRHLPAMVALNRVAQQGNLLLSTVPPLIYAESLDSLKKHERAVTLAEEAFISAQTQTRAALEQFGGGDKLDAINGLSSRIGAHLQILQSAMEHGWRLRTQLDTLMRRQRPLSQRTPHILLPVIAEQIPDATPRHLNEIAFELDRMPWIDDAIRAEIRRMVALRRGEIQAHAMAARQLDRIRSLSARLDTEIDRLIEDWQALSTIDNDALTASLNHSRLILFLTSGCAVAGALAIAWLYVGRRVVRRITAIKTSMRTIAAGDFDAQIPAGGTDEVTRMEEALAVFRDAMRRLAHLAHHDPLTGLLNRNGLTTVGAILIRDHTPGALIYFNLESFKDINYTFGHDSGDHILVEVAARLRTVAAEPWLLARLGGNDFAILAPDCDEATALTHAALIQGALTVPITSDVLTVDLRAVIGVVAYPAFGVTPHELLQRADMAMNAARTHEDAPIRWAHLQCGAIPPCDFIPIAERSGLIQPLDSGLIKVRSRRGGVPR